VARQGPFGMASGLAGLGETEEAAGIPVRTARPAIAPGMPAGPRRRLDKFLAAAYHGDPADGPPSSCWKNPWAGAYAAMRVFTTTPPPYDVQSAQVREAGPWMVYVFMFAAVTATLLETRRLWLAVAVLVVGLAAPAVPDLAAAGARLRYRGRYVSHSMLGPAERVLLLRAQPAIDAIGVAAAALDGQMDDPRPGLGWHEWEIAAALRGITRAPANDPGIQEAVQSVTDRVAALEACAVSLARAAAALAGRDQALAASAGADPDLVAPTAAARHRIAELAGLTAQADTLTGIWAGRPAPRAGPDGSSAESGYGKSVLLPQLLPQLLIRPDEQGLRSPRNR
jgi:hypothetical protein